MKKAPEGAWCGGYFDHLAFRMNLNLTHSSPNQF